MNDITNWLMVIITTIYVIATIFICFYNKKAADAATKQTEEMIKQFYANNRPIINVEIVMLRKTFWAIRFTNNGTHNAHNVRIKLDDEFLNQIPDPHFKKMLIDNDNKIRIIGLGQNCDLFFGDGSLKLSDVPRIHGRISYNGANDSIYAEDFDINTQNYATIYSVDTDEDDIRNSLETISKAVTKISRNIEKNDIIRSI